MRRFTKTRSSAARSPTDNAPVSTAPSPRLETSTLGGYGSQSLRRVRTGSSRSPFAVETVSAGGTPTMWRSGELRPLVTEYRAGTYAFNDRNTVRSGTATLEEVALTVAATVVSRRHGRAIIDAGSKALSSERADDGFGLLLEAPGSQVVRLDEEHGHVELASGDDLELGQQVRVVPNHVCLAVNLVDELVAARDSDVVDRWQVERGR